MDITHAKVLATPEGSNANLARTSDWNANHKILISTSDPPDPVNRQVWKVIVSSSPLVVEERMYFNGDVYVLSSIEF